MGWCFSQHTSKLDIAIFPILFHMNHHTHLYACSCICIGHTLSLKSVTLRNSSPGGAESHFRLLKAVNNNNICSALIDLLNNYFEAVLRKTENSYLILFLKLFKSIVEWMNEILSQIISSPWKLRCQTRGVLSDDRW